MNTVVQSRAEKRLNLEPPNKKTKNNSSVFSYAKKRTSGAKVIRIEVYDVESFSNNIDSLCKCDAEICVQHVVKNLYVDDVYKSVRELMTKITDNVNIN